MTASGSGSIANDAAAMRSAATDFENTVNQCTSVARQMDAQVATLSASWTGNASRAYQNVMDAWGQQFTRVVRALDTMKDTLLQNSSTFQQSDDSAAQAASGIGSQL
jgi:ESAT-6 family protein